MRQPGDHIVLRQLFLGRVWSASPGIVVDDTAERLVVWLPPAVTAKRAEGDLFGEWTLRDHVVERTNGILRVKEPGAGYSLLHFWHGDGAFAGWYVNLEGPFVPSRYGWDYEDHLLDLWLDADGQWRWLDEDELARAVALGLRTEGEARSARVAGKRALARLLAVEGPSRTGWEDWRPDASWPLPALPAHPDVTREPPGRLR